MSEWLKEAVLKTVVPQGTGGSNPPCSVAKNPAPARDVPLKKQPYWSGAYDRLKAVWIGRTVIACSAPARDVLLKKQPYGLPYWSGAHDRLKAVWIGRPVIAYPAPARITFFC